MHKMVTWEGYSNCLIEYLIEMQDMHKIVTLEGYVNCLT